ncbi:5-deoxy-glucuronate isomerase, partial [Parapedobacter sp.]
MKQDQQCRLLAKASDAATVYQHISKEDGGWQYLHFAARTMPRGEVWRGHTGHNEYAIILLGGNYRVDTDKGNWQTMNGRKDVFSGMAHSLYLPRHTSFELAAESDVLDIA